ncbi:MAG: hypothetical protein Q7S01_04970 [bacterium]|nr:hypothetical protein [bacterium]
MFLEYSEQKSLDHRKIGTILGNLRLGIQESAITDDKDFGFVARRNLDDRLNVLIGKERLHTPYKETTDDRRKTLEDIEYVLHFIDERKLKLLPDNEMKEIEAYREKLKATLH